MTFYAKKLQIYFIMGSLHKILFLLIMDKISRNLLADLNISEQYLTSIFGVKTIARGLSYFKKNKVTLQSSKVDNHGNILIQATSEGSYLEQYKIQLQIIQASRKNTLTNTSAIRLESECSCPVGYMCKHAYASLLTFIQFARQNAKPDQTVVDLWLQQFNDVEQHSISPAEQNSHKLYEIIYVLKYDKEEQSCYIETLRAKRLKNCQEFGRGYKFVLANIGFQSSHWQTQITSLDEEISRLLLKPIGTKYYVENTNNHYELKGEFGEFALQRIIQSKRLFWLELDKLMPYRKGESRLLSVDWHKNKQHYLPVFSCSPEIDHIITINNLYFIDIEDRSIGKLEHPGINKGQMAILLKAPPVPEQEADKVTKQFLKKWPNSDMPTPIKLELTERTIRDQVPVPYLCLQQQKNLAQPSYIYNEQKINFAKLGFYYADQLIFPNSSSSIHIEISKQQKVRIERDLSAEQFAREQLFQLDFKATDLEHCFAFDYENELQYYANWVNFIEYEQDVLKQQGWQIQIDESFTLDLVEADKWYADVTTPDQEDENFHRNEWFSMELGIEVDGESINLLPLLVELLEGEKNPADLLLKLQQKPLMLLPGKNNQWIRVDTSRLQNIIHTLIELFSEKPLNDKDQFEFNHQQSLYLDELLNDETIEWKNHQEIKRLNTQLRDFKGISSVTPPQGLQTELRDYQKKGLDWLQFLRGFGFNGLLADDMGLGKTVQTLAHLLHEKEIHRPSLPTLIIAPTSLMGNWQRESMRFAPDLKLLLLHGNDRHKLRNDLSQYDVVLTSYALIHRDHAIHCEQNYHYIILDESQNIKNARSKTTQCIYKLHSNFRLCLTGTPVENHLGELWSMFHFLMPGYLGNIGRFNQLFKKPIELQSDQQRQQVLSHRINPFLLRRTKEAVATELPPKTEIIHNIELNKTQRDLYETIRLAMDDRVQGEISKKGFARSHIMILDALLKLRQVCCDPRLLAQHQNSNINSAKLDFLMELLPEMLEEGRKVIIFSQFVKMLNLIEKKLDDYQIEFTKLTGQTKKRDEAIDQFQQGKVSVFLISLKAGGVGLNLTAADTVIHFDPWWNPAVENQATDRAHRIGQDKPVFVYKLMTKDTVEEKILQLQGKKQSLADAVYANKQNNEQLTFNSEDLAYLLKPLE